MVSCSKLVKDKCVFPCEWNKSKRGCRKKEYTKNDEDKVVKLQSIYRKKQENKTNIHVCLRKDTIQNRFKKEILGYHMINVENVTGTMWEEINRNVVKGDCIVTDGAHGNHKSGKDNKFNSWNISNKANAIEKNGTVKISGYRLTTVCSSEKIGDEKSIKEEIEKRDSSFEFYSLLLRKNKENNILNYGWYIVPKEFHVFDVSKYPMNPKTGKKNDGVVGWESKYFDIRFSMSSQLWFNFNINEIEKYLIADVDVDMTTAGSLTFGEIYDIYLNNQPDNL